MLLVGTFRDTELDPGHPLPDLIADVERDRPVPRVRLGGMDEREVAALIGSWHGTEVEDDAVRAIRAETEGNPFFVKQLVRHLEEAGARRAPGGAATGSACRRACATSSRAASPACPSAPGTSCAWRR